MVKVFTSPDVTVATAGTRVQVSAVDTPITSITIQAHPDNTGDVYVGDNLVAAGRGAAINAGQFFCVDADPSGRSGAEEMILSDFWVDAENNGSVAKVLYIKRR